MTAAPPPPGPTAPGPTAPGPSAPASPEGLTADWFTLALRAGGCATTVVEASAPRPVGTGQMASCYRVGLAHERPGAGPASVVVKMAAPGAGVLAANGYRNEVAFYRDVAPTVAVATPRCWYAAIDDAGAPFALVLDDLAPAEQGDQLAGCTADEARLCVENLAGLHAPRWCDATLASFAPIEPDPGAAAMIGQFLRLATEAFCEHHAGELSAADEQVLWAFAEAMPAWSAGRPRPFGVIHGDFRCDNLLFGRDDRGALTCHVVDWQTAGVALPGRDLGYFLATSVGADDRRRHERELVAAYHERLVALGVRGYSLDECVEDYRYGAGHAVVVTVLGEYVATRTDRGHRMFQVMAERTCAALRDLDTLALVPG